MPSIDGRPTTRRALLASLGAASVSLAGCGSLLAPAQQRWSHSLDGSPQGPPVLAGGVVLVRTLGRDRETGHLTAVARGSGEEVWSVEVPPGVSLGVFESGAAATSAGVAFVGGATSLTALDVATGDELFSVPVGIEGAYRGPSVVPDDDGVVVSTAEGPLLALTPDGEERWRSEVALDPPVSTGGVTTVGTEREPEGNDARAVVGVRTDSGEERWRVPWGEWDVAGVAVDGDRVHTTGPDLRTYDAGTGKRLRRFDFGSAEWATTPPVFGGRDAFFVGTGVPFAETEYGTVYPFDTTLSLEYRIEEPVRDLTVDGLETYYVAVGTEVRAVDPESVSPRWQVNVTADRLTAGDGVCFAITRGEDAALVALADE